MQDPIPLVGSHAPLTSAPSLSCFAPLLGVPPPLSHGPSPPKGVLEAFGMILVSTRGETMDSFFTKIGRSDFDATTQE